MGSNMAESHPVGFHWPVLAQQRGAVLIHVDPRYTRTSAVADVFVKIRPGTDIAFLGGMIRYILEHERYFKEYVVSYTNAATLIADEYRHHDDDGLFAGFDPATGRYELVPGAWDYTCEPQPDGGRGLPRTDPTLEDPMCVLQILRRHYARYTPEAVSRVCGCRPEEVMKVAELLCRNSGRERTSAIAYALGWTQHSTGAQMIRAAAIIQLLLGNVGRPGGGVLALRGHACIQGATDIPVLFDMLPGYLPQPRAVSGHATLAQYLANGKSYLARRGDVPNGLWKEDVVRGAWSDMPTFAISLLKAWYGEAATPENAYRYTWLPKIDEDLSEMSYFVKMHQGHIRGTFLMGQNPAAGGPNARLHRDALRRLDWLVIRDFFETESASVWYADPEVTDPKAIPTEVFLLPAASVVEKDGSFTNTERMIQWHDRAILPPGDCRSDAWFAYDLGKRLKALYKDSPLERDAPLRHLTWDYDSAISGSRANPIPSRCSGRSTGIILASGGNCAGRPSSPAMARPPAGAGCIAVFSRRSGRTAPARRVRNCMGRRSMASGPGCGRRIAASCTTARRLIPRAGRGQSARSSSGGTQRRNGGPAMMCRISRPRRLLATVPQQTLRGWPRSLETPRSGCTRTAVAGCTCPMVSKTVPCRCSTSPSNRRS